jgi:hypothetical protein
VTQEVRASSPFLLYNSDDTDDDRTKNLPPLWCCCRLLVGHDVSPTIPSHPLRTFSKKILSSSRVLSSTRVLFLSVPSAAPPDDPVVARSRSRTLFLLRSLPNMKCLVWRLSRVADPLPRDAPIHLARRGRGGPHMRLGEAYDCTCTCAPIHPPGRSWPCGRTCIF